MPDIDEKQIEPQTTPEGVPETASSVQDVLDAAFPDAPDDPTIPHEEEPAAEPEEAAGEPEAEPAAEEEAAPAEPEKAAKSEIEQEMDSLGITKEKTRARFHELSEQAKKAEEYKAVLDQQEQVFATMENLGVTPDQFSQAIGLIGFINSNEPGKLEMAYEALTKEVELLARKLGKPAPGYDPVADEPELLDKVKRGELDQTDAQELARLRRQNTLLAERTQREQTVAVQQAEARACAESLNQLEAQLRSSDPLYETKKSILMPLLQVQMGSIPYADRPAVFLRAYQNIQLPAMVAPSGAPQVTRPDPANTARPKSGAGAPVPTSTLEAIDLALKGAPTR